jgi:hypothetical protein
MPIELTSKTLDLFLIDGWKIVFKLALALLRSVEGTLKPHGIDHLLTLEYEQLLVFLKEFTHDDSLDDVTIFSLCRTL